jgi:hypothetical protein
MFLLCIMFLQCMLSTLYFYECYDDGLAMYVRAFLLSYNACLHNVSSYFILLLWLLFYLLS